MRPAIIAHRGASGYRPEHTLAAYRLGAEQGADFIEPDLVITCDGVLVARHENEIGDSTDVAARPEFAGRRTTKVIDGSERSGWFVEDFALAELKTLRARERIPDVRPHSARYDGRFVVPTFAEVLDLRAQLELELERPIGVYPETKHPSYFRAIGLPLEEPLLDALRDVRAPVFVQSFEDNLRALRRRLGARLVQLMRAPGPLDEIAGYADAVGPAKGLVDAEFVRTAHAAGLEVHPYTFRREPAFLLPGFDDLESELAHFFALGVDAIFTDNPDIAATVRSGSDPDLTLRASAAP